MANNLNHLDEDSLRELFQSVGPDTTLPPGFESRLSARLVERLQADQSAVAHRPKHRRAFVWAFRVVSGGAAAVVLAVVIWLLAGGGVRTASADFADVLRRVREAASVAYDQVLRAPGEPEVRARVVIARPGRMRVTRPDGRVHIVDHVQGRCLILKPETRTARFSPIPVMESGIGDPLDDLERTPASAGRAAGTQKVGGLRAVLYEVASPRQTMRVFVDPQDELPVRIEATSLAGDGREIVTILEDFSWNEPIPDGVFSLDVPAGYTVEAEPSEAALLDLLRACADLGSGSFPDSLNGHAVLSLVLRAYPEDSDQVRAGEALSTGDLRGRAKEVFRNCLPGLGFIQQANENGSWRYAGRGIRLGDAGAAVCWWRSPGSTSFRVVYGDLQVRDVAPEHMRPVAGTHATEPAGVDPSRR